MTTAEIRERFLSFFEARDHEVRPSSSLVPDDDPTLLFTNSGMVQFKGVFLGMEEVPYKRAVTSQRCVRAGGKHNDLEEVGRTTRHHTFFEMLGNFSFGDYFKREAVRYGWDFLVDELGLDPERIYATVHHSDDEAADLWQSEVGLEGGRIYRLGDKDNFWQMADTGPCGPCSELFYDMRPASEWGQELSVEQFELLVEEGRIVELWNLVFMQFDRDGEGELHPLPAPSIDTGAGLERLAAVLQGVDSTFHTDGFTPLLERAAVVVGRPYDPTDPQSVSYRVLADHARAVAFLLADGVFPSNEGRGYVLRRILRRAVRHAWLLDRREATLVEVVDGVIDTMGSAYPELERQREYLLKTTRAEEERFLGTIEGGLDRFDQLAPTGGSGIIGGEDVFRLYDTFGFPLDLTELMARERGYGVDHTGFEEALEAQRQRSRADRAVVGESLSGWHWTPLSDGVQTFVGYDRTEVQTEVVEVGQLDDGTALVLRENPFYMESGGQVSDRGRVEGDGWSLSVESVRPGPGGRTAVTGTLVGERPSDRVEARASVDVLARHNTERNHTATHLLHAALRSVLGEHVMQRGSLVAPDRLRFDFAHTSPMTVEEEGRVQALVNEGIWADHPVEIAQMPYEEAVAKGAMALFGEKYSDTVRVVDIPGVSTELCGGTHVRRTAEIGLLRIASESGVAAGVRRIEAQTGPGAEEYYRGVEERLHEVASVLRSPSDAVVQRASQLVGEKSELETILQELRRGGAGAGGEDVVTDTAVQLPSGEGFRLHVVRLRARDADDARLWGDSFLESEGSGVAVLGAEMPGDKRIFFAFVTANLISRGIRADEVVRRVSAVAGGQGGGRPHMAQAGVGDPGKLMDALKATESIVAQLAGGAE